MNKSLDDVTQFHSVDQTTNPTFFTQFMDIAHALPTAQRYKQVLIEETRAEGRGNASRCWMWNRPGYPGSDTSSWTPRSSGRYR